VFGLSDENPCFRRHRFCTIVLQNGRIVEQGESRAMFANPQTGYTHELVEAVPHIETAMAVAG